ncbi:MAG: NUDIX domain-containing protein, partial [Flammeovirgaceae bacterium]
MSNNNDNLYRPCVGMMLLNGNNKVFVGQRIDKTSDAWQMPQGGIDSGEEPLVAAMRELLEEIGTN